MGGSSKQESHQVQQNTVNPELMGLYKQNYSRAQDTVGGLTPFTGPLTAGFNQNQTGAQGILSAIAQDPRYRAANQGAMGIVQSVADTNAPTVNASPYDAAQLSGTDLSPYLNPYTDQVVNTTLGDLSHAREQQGVRDNASATAAHAFGGSRQGVLEANTTNDYLRNVASTSAGLRSGAYSNAQQAALADIAARNQAGQFNSGQRFAADTANAGNKLAFGNQRLSAAGMLSSLNNNDLSLATQQGGILSAVGDAQQAQQQREFTDAYNAYLQGQQLTMAQQQLLNQALGIIPIEQTNTTDGTQTTKTNPGLGGILGSVASLGLAAATGGSSLGLTAGLGGLGGLFGAAKQTPAFMTNGQAYY